MPPGGPRHVSLTAEMVLCAFHCWEVCWDAWATPSRHLQVHMKTHGSRTGNAQQGGVEAKRQRLGNEDRGEAEGGVGLWMDHGGTAKLEPIRGLIKSFSCEETPDTL